MTRVAPYLAALALLALPLSAQDSQDDGSFLERLIEDSLSGAARDVTVTGFRGVLTGRATFETLTIADADGIWLSVQNAELDWNRLALLRRRLDVSRFTAEEITVERPPLPAEEALPSPEAAGPFSLPELPLLVAIDEIAAPRIVLGEALFGQAAEVGLSGSAALDGGEGQADLTIDRLDREGRFALSGAFANDTALLRLLLSVDEGPDGIVVNLIDLPGLPSLRLSVEGEDPIDDFTATILLATDGAERLTGEVATSAQEVGGNPVRRFSADISGDIAPLFLPAYQPFFGDSIALVTSGSRFADGRLVLDALSLQAEKITLDGRLSIAADGLPRLIDIEGEIAAADGAPVLLPIAGDPTRVDRVGLDIGFDAASGEAWRARASVEGLDRPDFRADALTLEGTGTISAGRDVARPDAVTAIFSFDAVNLDLSDPNLGEALGEDVTGRADLSWRDGAPLTINDLTVEAPDYGLDLSGQVLGFGDNFSFDGQGTARADDLAVFSGLAGRSLGGAADLSLEARAELLSGLFNIRLEGGTRDLTLDQPELDRVLEGQAEVAVEVTRDETGVRIDQVKVESPNASIDGAGSLRTGATRLTVAAQLADVGLVLPELSGQIALITRLRQEGEVWAHEIEATGPDLRLTAEGTVQDLDAVPLIAADLSFQASDLTTFAGLAGRPVAGGLRLGGTVAARADLSEFEADLSGTGDDLRIGQAEADRLLAGQSRFTLAAARDTSGDRLERLSLETPQLRADASGALTDAEGRAAIEAVLSDVGLLVNGLSGPLEVQGEARRGDGEVWTYQTALEGPDTRLTASGQVSGLDATPSLSADLDASLDDLRLLAPLAGQPLSGALTVSGRAEGLADLTAFDLDLEGQGTNLAIGQPALDQLLAGVTVFAVDADRTDGRLSLSRAEIDGAALDIAATGTAFGPDAVFDLEARLADIGLFVENFSGPVSVSGVAALQEDGRVGIDATGSGGGGIDATVRGSLSRDASDADLAILGRLPLGLANTLLAPVSVDGVLGFDLALVGPPSLAAVSGTLTSSGARVVLPRAGIALEGAALNAQIAGSQIDLDLTTGVRGGGQISVEGPIGLTPPFTGDLSVALNDVAYTVPELLRTEIDGQIGVSGPLTGGGAIAGRIDLGPTEVRVAPTNAGAAGPIPEITHVGEPAAVRETRLRAGVVPPEGSEDAPPPPPFSLDLAILAEQIFVRGRGLDAELGGGLQLTGSTTDVVPVGEFDLVRGRLDFLGRRLTIEDAGIFLRGGLVPILQVRAVSQAQSDSDIEAFILIDGPISQPDIQFQSEPPLPEDEVLAQLLFGTSIENISALQAAQLAAAVATLTGGGPGVVGNLRSGLGIDDLDVRTDSEGNTAVTAGAYISDNVYADVTTRGDGETEISINLDLTDTVTVTGSTDNQGESTIGIFFLRDY